MAKELATISPEGLEIANAYLELGGIKEVSEQLAISEFVVSEWLDKREVRKYIDNVYFDSGYRNRNKIAELLDEIIESKIEEARESEFYTKKDLIDLLVLANKIRQDEKKTQNDSTNIKTQTNVQINDGAAFGSGNYGKLMEALMKPGTEN